MRLILRSLLSILIGLCLHWPCAAQDPNPQSSFATTESLAGPSLELNFNDQTTAFLDQISGQSFVGTETVTNPSAPTGLNYAGYFDGTDNYVSVATSVLASNATFSYAGWVDVPTVNECGVIISNNPVGEWGSGGVAVGIGGAGTPYTFACSSRGNQLTVLSPGVSWNYTGANIGTGWHFIVVTRDGTTLRAYIDGTQTGTLTGSTLAPGTPPGGLNLGEVSSSSTLTTPVYFQGEMAGWHVYNVALSPSQVASAMGGAWPSTGLVGAWLLNEGAGSTAIDSSGNGNNGAWHGTASGGSGYYQSTTTTTTYTSGTVTPRQPGFDSTLLNNTSAEFPWNGWSAAPNNTLGAIEWNTPWTMMVQVDRLNWNRSGTLALASKGDPTTGNWWKLYLQTTANTNSGANGQVSQLCFTRHGSTADFDGWGGGVGSSTCTSSEIDAMPNGFSYNVVVEDSGTGQSGDSRYSVYGGGPSAVSLYVNGLGPQCVAEQGSCIVETGTSTTNQYGFGAVTVTVSGGTGYANSTAFTSSGGGANCIVSGTMPASSGVPTGTVLMNFDVGCTSAPAINLTSPSGTGATFTVTLVGTSMDSISYPLMVPGYASGGAYYGIAGTTTAQTPTYIDEFAIFPGNLDQTQVQDLFYWTKFYQGLLNPLPLAKTAFIFDDDGPNDEDNFIALQMAIAEHRLGYIQLGAVIAETDANGATNGAAIFRQMLDQAGLSDVPVGVAGPSVSGNLSTTAYNASTPDTYAVYPSAATVYQKVMAANPTTPVDIMLGGPWDGPASFMQSTGGLTLWNQDAANGGAVYVLWALAGCPPAAYPATTPCGGSYGMEEQGDYASAQYVLNNHGSMPLFHWGGTPQYSGPGLLSTRTSKDPAFLYFPANYGSDVRQAWDSLPMTQLVSNAFYGGVQIGYSGGTGYANQTYFTSTGGGQGCTVQGIMTASGGVPNGIETLWGASAVGTTQGIGHGCVNPSNMPSIVLTSPTGTGVTFTVYPTNVCGTYTITSSTASTLSSTPCSDEYFIPFSQLAVPGNAPVLTWFINSLIDPPPNGRPRKQ